jgi:hypothetical protein
MLATNLKLQTNDLLFLLDRESTLAQTVLTKKEADLFQNSKHLQTACLSEGVCIL